MPMRSDDGQKKTRTTHHATRLCAVSESESGVRSSESPGGAKNSRMSCGLVESRRVVALCIVHVRSLASDGGGTGYTPSSCCAS